MTLVSLNAVPAFKPSPANVTIVGRNSTITRPKHETVSLKDGLRWRESSDWQYTEKMDGVHAHLTIGKSVIVGEQMRDGRFFAFDLPTHNGQDIRKASRRERLAILDTFKLLRPECSADGADLLKRVLARGGEGVVAAHWDAPFVAALYRCKRVETFDVTITGKMNDAVEIALDGQTSGKCPLSGHDFEFASIGDVIEISAFKRNASGKFREPRFLRFRFDK